MRPPWKGVRRRKSAQGFESLTLCQMNNFKTFLSLVIKEVEKEMNTEFPAYANSPALIESLKEAYQKGDSPEKTAAYLVRHWRTFAVH
jgi:hypothetical protein